MRTSKLDKREYRHLQLLNGLRVLLIHDAEAEQEAAALRVSVGHMSDPDDIAGIAHFCEHMCFLGSEKFPEENAYRAFLQSHGGNGNASTSMENTVYHFVVNKNFLSGALDRFCQFFVCPLFTESCTEREMNAVDSEQKELSNGFSPKLSAQKASRETRSSCGQIWHR